MKKLTDLQRAIIYLMFSKASKKECWIWQGYKNTNGYALAILDGKLQNAHRFMYTLFYGEISAYLEIHHTCERKDCVNPYHLAALSKLEHESKHHPGVIIDSQAILHLSSREIKEINRRRKMWKEYKERKKLKKERSSNDR